MRWRAFFLVVAALYLTVGVIGCTNGGRIFVDADASDGFVDADASDGFVDTDAGDGGNTCDPLAQDCDGDDVIRCNETGMAWEVLAHCEHGCLDGSCLPCPTACAGRECGNDGCGGTCPPGCGIHGCCAEDGTCFSNRLKVISYNIGCSCGWTDNAMLGKIADLIVAEQGDVVGLQEYWWDYAGTDSPDTIKQLLADRGYPMYGVYEKRFNLNSDVELGQIVLSKQPLQDYGFYRFQGGHTDQDMVQSFLYPLGAAAVRVFSVHPQPGKFCDVVGELNQYLDGFSSEMGVLMGDFNALTSDPCFTEIALDFRDCCQESSDATCDYTVDRTVWAGGVNAPPDLGEAIDYVFVRRGTLAPFPRPWTVVDTRASHTINQGIPVSDHFPVITELAFCLPCANCLGTYADCNAACQAHGSNEGTCGWPESSNFGQCCLCR